MAQRAIEAPIHGLAAMFQEEAGGVMGSIAIGTLPRETLIRRKRSDKREPDVYKIPSDDDRTAAMSEVRGSNDGHCEEVAVRKGKDTERIIETDPAPSDQSCDGDTILVLVPCTSLTHKQEEEYLQVMPHDITIPDSQKIATERSLSGYKVVATNDRAPTRPGKLRGRLARKCQACRTRKLRCDPGVPTCGQCTRAGRSCEQ